MSIRIITPYHLGILQRQHTLVIQARKDKDNLSPELLVYLGASAITLKRLRLNTKTHAAQLLQEYNKLYPTCDFRRVVVNMRSK